MAVAIPTLETERLRLRKLHIADAEAMFHYISNDDVTKYMLWESHTSLKQTKKYIKMVTKKYLDGIYAWAITLKDTKEFIGMIDFGEFTSEGRIAEIGYSMSDVYWGKGLMSEAVQAVIDFGFNELYLERIYARCFSENIGSERVMQKAGMTYEGTLRKGIYIKGAYHDLKMYAILREDYKV